MGSLDGAEISEQIGLSMLSEIKKIDGLNQRNNGLHRDDGLILREKCPGPKRDRVIKNLHKLFRDHGLKITIVTAGPVANFLDVTLDLSDGTYKPFRKPNDIPVYINAASNHPPSILKHIPKMVERRLNNISCNEAVFNNAKLLYEDALRRSGFDSKLTYDNGSATQRKKRRRKITWFNRPSAKALTRTFPKNSYCWSTNISRPTTSSGKRKIFNRNTLKVSPRCMPNIDSAIKSHNNRLLKSSNEDKMTCNCRKKRYLPR